MNAPAVTTPLIVTELGLTPDQISRVRKMVSGDGHFDYENRFTDKSGEVHDLHAIHFTSQPKLKIANAETTIDSIDSRIFEQDIFIYLEDKQGGFTGIQEAREAITAKWHGGIIFKDYEGQGWFCGDSETGSSCAKEDSPVLRKISLDTIAHVLGENGEISELMPSEGEFWLTNEDDPKIISVPWCSGYAEPVEENDTWPGRSELRQQEADTLRKMIERTQEMSSEMEPA
jgi:hypothetical protein